MNVRGKERLGGTKGNVLKPYTSKSISEIKLRKTGVTRYIGKGKRKD